MDDTRTGTVEKVDTVKDLYEIRRLAERLAFAGFVGKDEQAALCRALESFGQPKEVKR